MKPTLKELYALGFSRNQAYSILNSLEIETFLIESID